MLNEMKFYTALILVLLSSCNVQRKFEKQYNTKAIVYYLSADELQGRLTGSKGETLAANYLKNAFKALRLKDVNGNDYFHRFTFKYSDNPHDTVVSSNPLVKGVNVVGFLDNNAKKTIVIGAHYDHIGRNEYNLSTKANAKGEIHNGADDNASGVAGLLMLAKKLSHNNIKEQANFIFACFSGEELGLIGSKKLVEYFKNQNINISAMLNMDMIGRMTNYKLHIGGVGTSSKFQNIIVKNKPKAFKIAIDSSGVGPSDYTSFYLNNTPVLSFFTGTHNDYHKPSDDVEHINFRDLDAIINYVYNITLAISDTDLDFLKTKQKQQRISTFKVTLGIMPSYIDSGDGLHIDGVINGRVAHKAGLLKGDIIIKLNDCTVKEIYSYMECLSKFNSGDKAVVTYLRNKKIETTQVVF